MNKLKWPTNKETDAYMAMRKQQNLEACAINGNENWMRDHLNTTGLKWSRQARWGYRLFDFWCAEIGTAVEVDGHEHSANVDAYRDEYNFRRSGVVVLRVRNRNEADAAMVLRAISKIGPWKDRRERMGLEDKSTRTKLARAAYGRSMLGEFVLTLTKEQMTRGCSERNKLATRT